MKTEIEVKHTATPWKLSGGLGFRSIKSTGNYVIATGLSETTGEWDANAAFIVRAVNSHDELLELAKMYLYSVQPSNPNYDSIMKTIAKAEGK